MSLQQEIQPTLMGGSSGIVTWSGEYFDPINPVVELIHIEDIAHSVANQCRYTGHTRKFYSVGEHSIRVCRLLKEQGYDKTIQLTGLLHDASEAYLSDLPRPIKKYSGLGEIYLEVEHVLERKISERFDLPWPWPSQIKRADDILLATEIRDLMPSSPVFDSWKSEEKLRNTIVPWTPEDTEDSFLFWFTDLGGQK